MNYKANHTGGTIRAHGGPEYYGSREEAEARLAFAKEEFPPGSVVRDKYTGIRHEIKNWYTTKPGFAGMGVWRATVLSTILDEGYHGDWWLNVNKIEPAGMVTPSRDD